MNPVNALATQPHYVAHLAPLWLALDPAERGTFHAMGPACAAEAARYGIPPAELQRRRTMPAPHRIHEPVWLVASWWDLDRLGPRRRAVFVEHGAGQQYLGNGHPENYPGGPRRERVALFLCPSPRVADANRATYPRTPAEVVGCAHVERLAARRTWAEVCGIERRPVLTFHFDTAHQVAPEARSALGHYLPALPTLARQVRPLGHGHPRAWAELAELYAEHGIEPCEHQDDALARASVLIADNTSAMFEAAALDVPVVVLNAPWYRRDVHHGLRFWDAADVGLQVNEPDELVPAIAWTLHHDPLRDRRRAIAAEVYPQPEGGAARAAVLAMRHHLR